MAKFNLKEHIAKNKATFFGSLTEGQFSWMTQDTGQQIGSQDENKIPVYMFDNNGKYYYENDYDGYGVFGGMDYYELLDKMNGGIGDRSEGIRKAFDKPAVAAGEVLFPALVTDPYKFNYKTHDFTQEAETDPNQSWYEPEEDKETDYGYGFGDMDKEEDYDEDELDENVDQPEEEGKGPSKTDLENEPETELNETAYNAPLTDEEYELVKKEMARFYKVPEENLEGAILDDYSTNNLKQIAPALGAKDLYSLGLKLKAAKMGARVKLGTWEPEAGLPSKDIVYPPGSRMDETNKPTTKMKKSELKAKIKEMIVAEINLDVDKMEDAPEKEVDFLAELEAMLNEADETEKDTAETDTTDVTVDDTETVDTTTTAEVDPNVKAVQDALTQAQVAAEKLGDKKLTDQIGNTITFFTRTHVVEKGAVAEGELKEFQKPEEDSNIEVLKKRYQFVPLEDLETIASKQDFKVWTIGSPDFDANAIQLGDYIKFPMDSQPTLVWKADEKSVNADYDSAEYSKYNRSLLSKMNREASTGIKEDKKKYYKDAEADDAEHIKALEKDMEDDKKSSINESMFPMLKKILK